ncbi:MAG: endolytic transglycosylase MltG, partial [Pseudobdellovibrionaceae bacterium]
AEGALLPGTYRFEKGQSTADMIAEMQEAMIKALDQAWAKRSQDLPFTTREEALVLASVIEKETAKPEERTRIAGVFTNRLRESMPLQTDPTVIYAITKGREKNEGMGPLGRRLLLKDLKIDSPYNTYLYAGLPPGPICNPGLASIEAALHPEENEYLFFVADGTGGHVFSKTLKEHEANRANWRKIRREQSTAPKE